MVRLNKIYTRTGDLGDTGLVDGSRVSKADNRISAIGDVDEANSAIGLALVDVEDQGTREMLGRIQNEMFDLGADLATPGEDYAPSETRLRIVPEQVKRLESEIDQVNELLGPLKSFILPAGKAGAAQLHVARTIVRRAERTTVSASTEAPVNPLVLVYLNRLSDLLFVVARWLAQNGGEEVLWQPGRTRAR